MATPEKTAEVLRAIVLEEYEPLARKWVSDIIDSECRMAESRIRERCRSLLYDLRFNVLTDHLSERGIKLTIDIRGLDGPTKDNA